MSECKQSDKARGITLGVSVPSGAFALSPVAQDVGAGPLGLEFICECVAVAGASSL